nr:MAG TPA_asm: tail tape measure protein [Caudoviricetes sp.]
MPSLKFDAVIETAKVTSGFKDIQNAVHNTAETVKSEGESIEDVINKIKNAANIAIGGWSIGKFVNQMMQVRGQFQQTEMAFKTMLQSEEKANDLMQQIIHTAAITPFGVEDVTEGAKQLLAFNVAAEDVNDTLIRLGDVASGMGVSLSEMVMLYGTTIAKGKMDTMDLYQFLNRGIPIADELAKVMGLDVNNAIAEVKEQLTAGKVTSDIFIKAMQNMTSEGSKFGGLMEAQSETITGQIRNIEDAIEQKFNELGKSQEGIINKGLDVATSLVENWQKVGEAVMVAATAYGTYKAVLMTVTALQTLNNRILQQAVVEKTLAAAAGINLSNAEAVAAARTKFFTLAQKGLTAALKETAMATLANPYVLLAAAITSVVYAIYKFSTAASAAEIAQEAWNKSIDEFNKKAEERKQKIKELVSTIQDASSTDLQKQLSFDELKNIAPELTKVYDSVEKLQSADLSQFNTQLNEMSDREREEGLKAQIKQLQEYAKALQDVSASAEAGNARRVAVQGLKDNYGIEASWSLDKADKLNDSILEYITKLEGELGKIQKAKDELSTPTEIEIKLAEKEYKQSKESLDYLSNFALAMKNDIERNPTKVPFDGGEADRVISELESKADELRKEQRDNPIQFTADKQKALDKYQELLGDIKRWRNTAWKQGTFTIPVEIQFKMKKLEAETNKAKGRFNYLTGKYEQANKDESYATAKKQAKIDYEAAVKAEKEARKGSNKGWEEKKEDLDKKKKVYEKYWGNISAASNKANKAVSDAKKKVENQRKAQEEINEKLKELIQKNTYDTISLMRDGTEKKLKEIDNDYKKRLAEIDKQETEFKKKNKEAGKSSTLTREQSKALGDARSIANLNKVQQLEEINKELLAEERNNLYDYLKEYGSIQQQKLAITQEYADKIAKAENAYQKASLANQRDNELKKLDASDIFEQIDWENVFADLSSHTKEYIVSLRTQLQSLLKSGKLTDVSDISKVQEKINDLNAEISKQGGIFDFVGTKQQEQIRRINEAKEAQEALNAAKSNEADIEKQYEEALKAANYKATDLGVRAIGDDTADIQSNLDKFGIDKSTKEYKEMSTLLSQLAVLEGKLAEARKKTAKATAEAKSKEDSAKRSSAQSIADWFTNAQEFITKKGIDELPELFEKLGMDGIAGKATQGLSAFNDAAGAAADFASGNYIGALTKGVSALQNFTSVLGIGGDNTAKMQKKIDELNLRNDVLAKRLEELNDTLQSTNSITGAQDVYKEAVELIKAEEKNSSSAMIAEAKKHGTWRSSLNSSVDDNRVWKESMKQVSNILGKKITSSKDFLSLSAGEMKKIRNTDKELFMSILNEYRKEGGKGGRSDKLPDMIQDYIDKYADAINDLTEQLQEKFTQMSFDDLENSFFDTLMDMSKDVEDFTDDFSKYLMRAVLKAKVGDLLDKDLKEFYDEWSKLAEDGLSQTEIDYLNQKYNDLIKKGLELRNEASKITGYTGEGTSQSATSGGWQSMGQDTADELNGRFTALQIAGENISSNMIATVAHMETIVATGISTNGAVLEIRNMMIMTNSYLEDIVKYAKLTYNDFGAKIDDMNKRLKEI